MLQRVPPLTTVVTPDKLDALTGLRFLAAAPIVYLHYQGFAGIPVTSAALGQGVSYFFVLSGFVLAYMYPALPTWRAKCNFLAARFARLWPVHVIGIVLAIFLMGYPASWGDIIVNMTLLQAWVPVEGIVHSINGPSWSISTELGFYLAFLLLIQNFERTWRRKLILSALLLAGLLIFCVVAKLPWSSAGSSVSVQSLVYSFPAGRLFEFVCGMCLALLYRRYRPAIGLATATVIELGIVTFAVFYAIAMGDLIHVWYSPLTMYTGFSAVLPASILIFFFAQQRGAISNLLASPAFVLLGELSYSIYMFHGPVGRYFLHNKAADTPDQTTILFLLVCLLALSYLSWMLVETPFRLAVKKLLRRPKPISPVVSVYPAPVRVSTRSL